MQSYQKRLGGQWGSAPDLPAAQVADAIAGCDIGLLANGAGTLTKSGVFAALATNGVVGVVSNDATFAVPPPFNDCVLVNDGQPGNLPVLLAELRGNNRMRARRRLSLRAAQEELSWSSIAQSWCQAVQHAVCPLPEPGAAELPLPGHEESRPGRLVHGGARA